MPYGSSGNVTALSEQTVTPSPINLEVVGGDEQSAKGSVEEVMQMEMALRNSWRAREIVRGCAQWFVRTDDL